MPKTDPRSRGTPLELYIEATFPGAKCTSNSGATFEEGDVHTERFLIEAKTKSTIIGISFSGQEVRKAIQQGIKRRRTPLLVLRNRLSHDWACLPYQTLVEMQKRLDYLEGLLGEDL